ncbi:MAG TPA: hypothetical protein DCS75_01120 [Gemmatimonadetes bacterium]|nr:hypothetical protein [Gemmatimonadota bacterium]HAT37064.1 hypothetical protein [Gemmatimonadota bacterium]HBV05480.1 hypothetical protein [Gemmatimonadota bacterium]
MTGEILIPASVLKSMHSEIAVGLNTTEGARMLSHVGYQSGLRAASLMNQEFGGDSSATSQDSFWASISSFFLRRGWGKLSHSIPHRAIGVLSATDWAEAKPQSDTNVRITNCSFSEGYLSGILSKRSGRSVAVLEISCQTRGDDACEFAFGSESTIQKLDKAILNGAVISNALEEL